MSSTPIQYLRRAKIDVDRWDTCIAHADNSLIYAHAFSLDQMAEHWDALVWGDYEIVMPLPWKQKWGIRYVYTPLFFQRLGIFGKNVDGTHAQAFYQLAARHFSFIDLMADQATTGNSWKIKPRKNFIIPLASPYHTIRERYTDECVKNIRKAESRYCLLTENVSIEQVMSLYRRAYGSYSGHIRNEGYARLRQWAEAAAAKGMLKSWGVVHARDNELLFGALLFQCHRRLYYLLGAPTAAGRQARATYYFIDQVLQRHAGQPLLFDFEGSDIPDVAAFYRRFGPQEEAYYHLLYNGLPWWIKWLKQA